jgi:hypothetical protein
VGTEEFDPLETHSMGLTAKEIENAKPGSKPYKLADGGGVCLLISPTGA